MVIELSGCGTNSSKGQVKEDESTMYREELLKAQENDRRKITELEGIVKELKESHETFDQRVQELMQEQLKVRASIR